MMLHPVEEPGVDARRGSCLFRGHYPFLRVPAGQLRLYAWAAPVLELICQRPDLEQEVLPLTGAHQVVEVPAPGEQSDEEVSHWLTFISVISRLNVTETQRVMITCLDRQTVTRLPDP